MAPWPPFGSAPAHVIVSFLLVLLFVCLSVHLCALPPYLVNKDVYKFVCVLFTACYRFSVNKDYHHNALKAIARNHKNGKKTKNKVNQNQMSSHPTVWPKGMSFK